MDSLTRRWVLLIFALMALSGAVVAALATTQQRDEQLRGYVDATTTLDLPLRIPRLGVNAELTQYNPSDELDAQLQLMRQVGIHWVRQFFPWDMIEPEPGVFEWDRWDAIVAAVDRYPDLELVAVLINTPAWARIRPDAAETAPPADVAAFAVFASTFAERYGHTIHYYQVWDEPNIGLGWGGLQPNAASYASLLHAAYKAIHNQDADAYVLAAALAPTTETGPDNISDLIYLQHLYDHGAADFADAFAGKPYGYDHSPEDRMVSADRLNFSRLIALREVMGRNGDGRSALWASAWGWNSLPPNWQGQSSIWGSVTADQQAQYTIAALGRADREWPWLGGMILSHWQPAHGNDDDPWWGFAVIDQQNEPGELWSALAALSPADAAAHGHYPPHNPYARYSGIWSFSGLGADPGWVNDSHVHFDYIGSDVALIVREGDFVASFYATVNDQQANALPRDPAGNAFLLLRTGDFQPRLSIVPVASRLDDNSVHTLKITVDKLIPDEAIQRWPLVGFAVSPGDVAAPYNRQIAIAWVAALIGVLSVIATGASLPWQRYLAPFSRYWGLIGNVGQIIASLVASLALLGGMLLTYHDGIPALFRRDTVNLLLSITTAGFIYWNNYGPLLTILAAVVLFIIIYNRLELGVLLAVFFAPFFLFPVELYRFAFPMMEILILLTASAWMMRLLVSWAQVRQARVSHFSHVWLRERLAVLHLMDYLVIAWVVLGFISLSWVEYRSMAVTEVRTLIVEPSLLYGALRYVLQGRQTTMRLVTVLILAGVSVAIIGLLMFVLGEQIITAEAGARRLASVYGSPNNVGLFLGRCIPFALAFMIAPINHRWRVLAGLASLVMLSAVVLSQSAGAIFLGIPAAVALLLALHWRWRALLPLAGLTVVLMVSLGLALQMPRFARALDLTEGTNFYRVRVWESAINMIGDRPLTGFGPDQFLYAFRGAYIMPDAWEEPDLSHPHNLVLDQWVRLGIAGLGLLMVMQFVFWRRLLRLYRRLWGQPDPVMLAVVMGALASMFNLLVHGMVDHSIYVIDLAVVFSLLIALAVSLPNVSAIDESPETVM